MHLGVSKPTRVLWCENAYRLAGLNYPSRKTWNSIYRLGTLHACVLRGGCVTELLFVWLLPALSIPFIWSLTLIIIYKYVDVIFCCLTERARKLEAIREGEKVKVKETKKRNEIAPHPLA